MNLCGDCKIELRTSVITNDIACRAIGGEAKSIRERAPEQIAQYCMWGIQAACDWDNKPGDYCYYHSPPLAFGIMSLDCPLDYYMCVEPTIGGVFMSFVTKPLFCLSSNEHSFANDNVDHFLHVHALCLLW